jgi:serine/threonine-protein kinase
MKLCPKCQKQFSDDANFCPVDAARLVPLEQQVGAVDSLTSRFELGQRLGGSRTGAVHRAVDKTTGRPCTVKLVSRAVLDLPGVAQRLERELKQLERVQSPGVAHVLASGKRAEDTWIAVELLDGAQTLAEAIGARGPIPPDQAADLIELVGEALIEAAQVGVVHRDLAPKNILFARQDVKLINFSLPVPTSDKSPGIPEFLAPEVQEGKPVDQRSNLYSLGALYYYVLTSTPPIADTSGVKPPSQLTSVPPAVDALIVRALDRSPTKRFLTVRQFVDEVMRVGHGEVIELTKSASDGRVARPKGELVQTLMGFRTGGGMAPNMPVATPFAASSAPTQAPIPAVVAAPVAPQRAANPAHTIMGVPSMGMHGAPAGSGVRPMTPAQGVPGADPNARSPWAAPGPQAPAIAQPGASAVVPPAVAPPVVAAPQVAAPQVAAPQVAPAAAGKRRSGEEAGGKGKFRETMWFKKGDLDVQAAQAAAEEQARTGKVADKDRADSLPLDERYKDDGSISRADKEKYSLRTGSTMMMSAAHAQRPPDGGASKVSEDALIGEMKRGRLLVILAIVIAVAAVIGVVVVIAR